MPSTNAAVASSSSAALPIGDIDYNRPIRLVDNYDDDAGHTDVKVLTVIEGATYPIVIQSTDPDGDIVVGQFDLEGDHLTGDLRVKNLQNGPATIYVAVLRDGDGELYADQEVYTSERDAIDGNEFENLVFVSPVEIPDVSANFVSTTKTIGGQQFSVGERVSAYRRGFGTSTATIVKFREHPSRSLYIQPEDGRNAYWAVNSNISKLS